MTPGRRAGLPRKQKPIHSAGPVRGDAARGMSLTGHGHMPDTARPKPRTFRLPDPAQLGRSMADIAERSQRIVGDWLKRRAVGVRPGPGPAEHRRRLHGDDRQADGQPGPADAGAARLLAGLHDALAEHRAAHDGRRGRARSSSRGPEGPPLQGRGLEGERGLRLHQADLSARPPASCRTWWARWRGWTRRRRRRSISTPASSSTR